MPGEDDHLEEDYEDQQSHSSWSDPEVDWDADDGGDWDDDMESS